jgi:hypothetical protein
MPQNPDIYPYPLHLVRAAESTVAQLFRALHRNRRTTGLIPARGPIVAFLATALSLVRLYECCIFLTLSISLRMK